MKKALAICAAVAVLLAAILVIVPAFVDLGAYKNTYLPLIEESLGRIGNHKQAHLAYLESRHAVERIIERHGQEGIRAILSQMSTGAPFESAFTSALGEDYATFAAKFDAEGQR